MSKVGSSYADYLLKNHNARASRNLARAAEIGMWPFKAERIEIYDEFAIDYNKYRITVGWFLMSGKEYLPFTEYIMRDDMVMNPNKEMLDLCNKVLQYYRFEIPTIPMYIEDTPTHPHITLGEN